MDKMKMETANKTLENLAKLKEMFPEVITETKDANGDIVSAVDAKKLEQLLSTKVIEGDESYDFTWVGKKQAMVEANRPIRKTLRPCKEESVDWENTENLYIEGDNLDVLKLLQESYLNKIKMIYIDPPYNTGNDFIYNDNFTMDKDEYEEGIGLKDEEGNKQFTQNNDSNPRFHSDWCSMMYPRLKLARNLLSEDGVIFISIDDNEVDNMRKICDEVFGENNFVTQFVWQKNFAPKNDNKYVSISTEYILLYSKNKVDFDCGLLPRTEKHNQGYSNPDNDIRGMWTSGSMLATTFSAKGVFEIVSPNGTKHLPAEGRCWRFSQETIEKMKKDNRIWYGSDGNGVPRIKRFLSEMPNGIVPQNLLLYQDVGSNQEGTNELKDIFKTQLFSFPKGSKLLKHLITIGNAKNNSIILDFFSGSATTAHAVMQLNAEDGGNRKFIMVQLPEVCDEKSEAYKAGYTNICEIGKERIRRAGKKIKEETGKQDLDIGFRVLKLDESNMKDVYYTPDKITQSSLLDQIENIKEGRTGDDLLYACMLEWGVELSLPHKIENIDGFNVHIVNDGDLIACFDKNITDNVIRKIAKMKPLRVVFRDASFETDAKKTNMKEIFKLEFPSLDNEGLKRKVRIL